MTVRKLTLCLSRRHENAWNSGGEALLILKVNTDGSEWCASLRWVPQPGWMWGRKENPLPLPINKTRS